MYKRLFWPVLIDLLAVIGGILVLSNSGWLLRPAIMFGFILFCPGMAVIGLLRVSDPLSEIVLAVALSLAISTILASLMIIAHLWSPPAELTILIVISLLGANLQLKSNLRVEKI